MRTRHSQKKGGFSNCDKTNPVMNDNELKSKSFCGLVGNSFQLVLGHCTVRLVIDPLDFALDRLHPLDRQDAPPGPRARRAVEQAQHVPGHGGPRGPGGACQVFLKCKPNW